MAHSQSPNLPPAAPGSSSSTNLPSALQALVSSSGGRLKVSATPDPHAVMRSASTAGVYATMDIPSLKDLLLPLDPTMKVTEPADGGHGSVLCSWPDVTIRLTLKQSWDASGQRQAMKNWVAACSGSDTNQPETRSFLRKVDASVACIGVVASPEFDAAGKAFSLVLRLAGKVNGYIFTQQAFYDPAGDKIIGATNAPAKIAVRR